MIRRPQKLVHFFHYLNDIIVNRDDTNNFMSLIYQNSMVKNTNQLRSNRKKPSLKNDREVLKDQQDLYNSSKHQTEVICFESVLLHFISSNVIKYILCFNCMTQSVSFK